MQKNQARKILLVEDESQYALLVEEMISPANEEEYAVSWVDTLAEGKQALAGDNFDLVLLDLSLPDSQGLETLNEVLKKCGDTPVVVLTGVEDDSFGKTAIRQGATDYLFKSEISKRLLIRSIEYAIQRGKITLELKKYQTRLEELVDQRTVKLEQEIYEKKQAEKNLRLALAETQKREQEITALLSGAQAVLRYRHFPEAARKVFNICKELTNATAGYVALLSEDGKENEVLFLEAGNRKCSVDPELPMPIRGLRAVAYEKGEVVYDNNFMQSKWMDFMPSGHVDLDNVLFAPLKVNNQTVGVMGLANKPGGFSKNDLRLATAFGKIVSVSLMNSRNLDSLAESRKRFNELFHLMNDGVMMLEKIIDKDDFEIKFINKAALQMFNLEPGHAGGEPVSQTVSALNLDRFLSVLRKVYLENQPLFPPPVMKSLNDKSQWIAYYVYSLPTKEIVAVFRDITQQRNSREELRQSEERYRELIKSSPDPIAIYGQSGLAIDLNPAFEHLFGWKLAEVKGQKINFVPKDQQNATAAVLKTINQGGAVKNFITKRYTKQGDLLEVEISATAFKNTQGNILGIVVFFRDITEQRNLERKIRQNERNLRKILDELNTGIIMVDYHSHIIKYANPLALKMIGLPIQEVTGKVCHHFICKKKKDSCPITDRGEKIRMEETSLLTKEGIEIPVLKSAVLMEMEGKKTILSSFQDITNIKQAHAEIVAKGKLEAAMETAAVTCHQLNQPLQAIINLGEAALEDIEPDHQVKKDLENILANTRKMAEVTAKLSNITEYKTRKYSDQVEMLDVS